eukprot:1177847-Prorocentrum_minimum.AAC.2
MDMPYPMRAAVHIYPCETQCEHPAIRPMRCNSNPSKPRRTPPIICAMMVGTHIIMLFCCISNNHLPFSAKSLQAFDNAFLAKL